MPTTAAIAGDGETTITLVEAGFAPDLDERFKIAARQRFCRTCTESWRRAADKSSSSAISRDLIRREQGSCGSCGSARTCCTICARSPRASSPVVRDRAGDGVRAGA